MSVPDDITPILREIDQSLKDRNIQPHSRPLMAVIEFGRRYRMSLPLSKPPFGASEELLANGVYTDKILRWYEEIYGELIKTDFSEKAKVAVMADGDMWAIRIPLIYGRALVEASRNLADSTGNKIGTEIPTVNVCASLTNISAARLQYFSDDDLIEVYAQFVVGLDVRKAFDRFRGTNPIFAAAEDDGVAAVANMTGQTPNWGHSRWASLQMTEKFLKGLITLAGDVSVKYVHDLMRLHDDLKVSAPDLDLKHLLVDIQCEAGVRYNDPKTPSSRLQAYKAHKASLLVVRVLGGAKFGPQ